MFDKINLFVAAAAAALGAQSYKVNRNPIVRTSKYRTRERGPVNPAGTKLARKAAKHRFGLATIR